MQFVAVGQEAIGVIAIGQQASGIIAIGQLATGVIAIGQLARGVVAIGQLSFGIVGVGMIAPAVLWGAPGISMFGLVGLFGTVSPVRLFQPAIPAGAGPLLADEKRRRLSQGRIIAGVVLTPVLIGLWLAIVGAPLLDIVRQL